MTRGARRAIAFVVAAAALLGAGASSIHVVNQNEAGVVMAFGAAKRVVPPGMHVSLPWPFGTVERVDVNFVDRISVGFRLLEQQFGLPPTEDMTQWLTGDTNIAELQALALFTIDDPLQFLFGISDPGDPGALTMIAPQRMVVRRAAEAALTRRIATMSIDELLGEGKIALQLEAPVEIQEMLDRLECGIRVVAVQIVSINPPKRVLDSFTEVQNARSDRERRITEADGYQRDELPRARSRANGLIQDAETERNRKLEEARGKVAAFEKLRLEAQHDRAGLIQRLWTETTSRVLARARVLGVAPAGEGDPTRIFIETR
jgi:membrane protease subunit HflK